MEQTSKEQRLAEGERRPPTASAGPWSARDGCAGLVLAVLFFFTLFVIAYNLHGAQSRPAERPPGLTDAYTPVPPTDVVAVAAGVHHSLALQGDGTVVAWGDDRSGQATVPEG